MTIKKMLVRFALVILTILIIAASYAFYQMYSHGLLREPHYDTVAPPLPTLDHPAVLVLDKTNGYIHKEALPASRKMLDELAKLQGWHVYQTNNAATHNEKDLQRFDLVIWNNTSGDILTDKQREAFRSWLEEGGAWLGLHAAGGDRDYAWSWFPEALLGAQFIGHTMLPHFQQANVIVADPSSLTEHLPRPWSVGPEEWYAFDRNPRDAGATILLSLDENSYQQQDRFGLFPDTSMAGEHPIAWSQKVGEGVMVYSGIGHQAATYELPAYREFIVRVVNQLTGERQ